MTTITLALILLSPVKHHDKCLTPSTGYASYYGQEPTDGTIAYRLHVQDVTIDDLKSGRVFIAVSSCKRIGERGRLYINGKGPVGYVVFDCSGHPHTTAWMSRDRIAGEIDYYTRQWVDEDGPEWVVMVSEN